MLVRPGSLGSGWLGFGRNGLAGLWLRRLGLRLRRCGLGWLGLRSRHKRPFRFRPPRASAIRGNYVRHKGIRRKNAHSQQQCKSAIIEDVLFFHGVPFGNQQID